MVECLRLKIELECTVSAMVDFTILVLDELPSNRCQQCHDNQGRQRGRKRNTQMSPMLVPFLN